MGEYCNIVTSKRWKTTNTKEKYQDDHLPLKFSTGSIEEPAIKIANKDDLKIIHSGKDNKYGGE